MRKTVTSPRLIIGIGLILYLISFLLPAYSFNYNFFYGYECAYIVFGIALDGDIEGGFITQILTRSHFFLLGLHNLILVTCLFLSKNIVKKNYMWLSYLLVFSTLNIILFFFYNYFSDETMNEVLRSGYYVWVLSTMMILLHLNWQSTKWKVD